MISSASQPNMRSAPGFQLVMTPLSVLLMMASSESVTSACRRCASIDSGGASTSRYISTAPCTRCDASMRGMPLTTIGTEAPSLPAHSVLMGPYTWPAAVAVRSAMPSSCRPKGVSMMMW